MKSPFLRQVLRWPPKVRLLLQREIAGVFLCSKDVLSVLNRTSVTEGCLAALLVVITNVFIYCIFELIEAAEYLAVIHLLFHYPKEVLHWRVVVAIALPRHALKDTIISQLLAINTHLVCPTTVRVESASESAIICCVNCFIQSCHDALRRWTIRDPITQDLQIPHVHERIKIELLDGYSAFVIRLIVLELSSICGDFLMRDTGVESPVHSVRSDSPYDTFVCTESAALPGV